MNAESGEPTSKLVGCQIVVVLAAVKVVPLGSQCLGWHPRLAWEPFLQQPPHVGEDLYAYVRQHLSAPAHRRRDRGQRQHRGPVSLDQSGRTDLDGAHNPAVRPVQPAGELGVKVSRRGEPAAGMNEVSKNPLRRSTIPFDSESRGRSCMIAVASVPVNAATPSASLPPRPIPVSLSQISRRGTPPSWRISSHDPSSRSAVVRVGIIRPVMNRE